MANLFRYAFTITGCFVGKITFLPTLVIACFFLSAISTVAVRTDSSECLACFFPLRWERKPFDIFLGLLFTASQGVPSATAVRRYAAAGESERCVRVICCAGLVFPCPCLCCIVLSLPTRQRQPGVWPKHCRCDGKDKDSSEKGRNNKNPSTASQRHNDNDDDCPPKKDTHLVHSV